MSTPGAVDRREFLSVMAALAAPPPAARVNHCLFSKHLEWIEDYRQLAETTAALGFEGLDLTVRNDGHIDPDKVEDELPKACEAIRKVGLEVPMITTRIADARKPDTRKILKTASRLGIRYYRRGGEDWGKEPDPRKRIAELQPKVRDLVALNQEYGMFAGIHNHSGNGLCAAVWDLAELVRPFDARYIGSNYDIGHATAEGGVGAWKSGFRLLASDHRIRMVAVKDFLWRKRDDGWRPGFCPLGQGMVDLKTFFGYLKENQFAGPISLHFEYSAEGKSKQEKQNNQLANMKRDLSLLKTMTRGAGLV